MSQTTPCPTCGAPVVPDQRYCLACGTRVAAPRLDFLAETERAEAEARNGSAPSGAHAASDGRAGAADAPTAVLPAPAPGATPSTFVAVPVAAAAPSRLDRIGGPMGAAAVVLVALGIGFLAGQAVDERQPAQQPPIVNIEGERVNGGAETPAEELPAAEETNGDADVPDDAGAVEPGAADDAGTAGDADVPDDAAAAGDDGATVAPDAAATPPAAEPAADGAEPEAIG